jgi:hypothetical protein
VARQRRQKRAILVPEEDEVTATVNDLPSRRSRSRCRHRPEAPRRSR